MSDEVGTELAPVDGPAPVATGQFALYASARGGMTMFYDVGAGMVRQDVPAAMVALFTGDGMIARRIRAMLGNGKEKE